jgi:hypothetical protein
MVHIKAIKKMMGIRLNLLLRWLFSVKEWLKYKRRCRIKQERRLSYNPAHLRTPAWRRNIRTMRKERKSQSLNKLLPEQQSS